MNLKQTTELMKSQTFGVEIEMGCMPREKACKIVADYFHTNSYYIGTHYDTWACKDVKGREWKFMSDGSRAGRLGSISCEMVTPILKYDDIETLQEIVRILRQAGAKSGADYNAGVHVHIGADFDQEGGQNAKTIRNLMNIMASHERILLKAIAVTLSVRGNWCKCVDRNVLNKMNTLKPKTKDELGAIWYGSERLYWSERTEHYSQTRYHMINLHALFTKGTIEFRLFEFKRGLHAGELKSWIQLCMALCSYAKLVKYASPKTINMNNEKYAMKNWLVNMGFIGDEFKTARKILTRRLSGDTAYRNGRPSTDPDDVLDTQSYEMVTE